MLASRYKDFRLVAFFFVHDAGVPKLLHKRFPSLYVSIGQGTSFFRIEPVPEAAEEWYYDEQEVGIECSACKGCWLTIFCQPFVEQK